MNNPAQTSTPAVKLISQIIGQELTPRDVSPSVIFMTAVLYSNPRSNVRTVSR